MNDDELAARLNLIELRLRRLEANAKPPVAAPSPPPQPDTAPAVPPPFPPASQSLPETDAMSLPPIIPTTLSYAPPPQLPSLQELEHQIGLKWAGWVGAIVLVIGAGLGIDFAYGQGWFGLVPPLLRMGILCAFAGSLLAAGEWVYRKVSPLAAVGLYAAGVATLLITCYAGHAYYGLYGPGAAWALMFAATLIGAGVARRANLVSIAVLSLVGGYLAPALLPLVSISAAPFCGYLLTLEAIALLLAGWGSRTQAPTKWWALRGVALTGTAIWMSVQLASGALTGSTVVALFLLASAVGFQAELIVAALRPQRADPRIGVNFSTLVTASLTAGLLLQFRHDAPWVQTAWMAALALAAAGVALLLRERPGAAARHLAIGYVIQSGLLLIISVPVALTGVWISLGWAVLALAFAGVSRAMKLPSARWGAIVCWCLAVGEVGFWTAGFPTFDAAHDRRAIGLIIFETTIPIYAIVGLGLAVVGQLVAKLIEPADGEPFTAVPVALAADALWALISLMAFPIPGATAMLLAGGVLLFGWAALAGEAGEIQQGIALLGFASAKWLLFDTFFLRFVAGSLPRGVLVDATTLVGFLLVVCWAVVLATEVRRHLTPPWRLVGAACCVLLVFWEGTLAVDRYFSVARLAFANPDLAEQVALSIFWSAFAIGAIAVGFGVRNAPLRYFGLGLFGLTLVKVFVIDLSQVSTGYRVLSFIGLGLLLLGTSVLYGKLSPLLSSRDLSPR